MNGNDKKDVLPEKVKRQIMELRSYGGTAVSLLGMKITDLGVGWAKGEMEIKERHLNPMGSVHGGFLFTLADSIGGTAAWTRGNLVSTTNASFNYFRPAVNIKKVLAHAVELKAGKSLLTYEVSLTSEEGRLLAKGIFEYHNFNIPFSECKKLYKKE